MKEIIDKYGTFSDALISKVCYERGVEDHGKIELVLNAMNMNRDGRFDKIKLTFSNILNFRFIEPFPFSSLIIYEALIFEKEETIVFNFFPQINMEENTDNEESNFRIVCKSVECELLETFE
ncbi:hypothetical protein [Flavobacterium beibuense]|nr:hypothetical protein [Flavobacterium beibuense]